LPSPDLFQHLPCEALLQDLHHARGRASLRLTDQQMDVLRHHHVAHNHEAIPLAYLFYNSEKLVPTHWAAQPGLAAMATASYEMQVTVAVVRLQAVGHFENIFWTAGKRLSGARKIVEECKNGKAFNRAHPFANNAKGWGTLELECAREEERVRHPPTWKCYSTGPALFRKERERGWGTRPRRLAAYGVEVVAPDRRVASISDVVGTAGSRALFKCLSV